jgi:glutathione S-transferase
MIALALNRYVIIAALAIAAAAGAFWKGYDVAHGRCQEDALRSQIAALQQDAANARKASDDAAAREAALQQTSDQVQQRLADYDAHLAQKPACALDAADLGLR